MVHDIGRNVLFGLGYFFAVASLIPLVRSDNWMFRIFEYPRSQKMYISLAILILYLVLYFEGTTHDTIFSLMLFANIVYLFYLIFPYTKLAKVQMKGLQKPVADKQFKLLICNVYQENRRASDCIERVRKYDPDLVLFAETNQWWLDQLKPLSGEYPFCVSKPLENTYGMVLFSRLELVDPKVKYLIDHEIPSIHTRVKLKSGHVFFLYCLHPQPPVPQENPRSSERDAEILTIAKEARACKYPVVVAGDLNDVAWSYTTELFLKVSHLLDPRRGRGFYNTFNARYWFFRWPLDHVFCSDHFQLVQLRLLEDIGSDHFPILAEFGMVEEERVENSKEELHSDEKEEEVAEEKIEKRG